MSVYHDRVEILARSLHLADQLAGAGSERTLSSLTGKITQTNQSGQAAFWLRPAQELDRLILHAIKSRFVAVESLFPGSGEICIEVFCRASREWMRRERSGISQYEIKGELERAAALLSAARPARRRLHAEDLVRMLDRVPSLHQRALIDEIEASPLGCMITVKRTRLMSTSLRKSHGCRISVSPLDLTLSRDVRNPRVILVDGSIDTVGQIHRVLEDSAACGTHYLIGCRGLAQDVERTLVTNAARGTIHVLAFLSRLDDLTIGALDDAAAYTGSRVITAQSGESVSTSFEKFITAPGRFWMDGSQMKTDAPPSRDLESHVSRLREDASRGDQSVQDFLTSRLLGLSSHRIELHMGESDLRSHPTMLETVDSDIRSLASSFTRGVCEDVAEVDASPWVRALWKGVVDRPLCAGSAEAGVSAGIRAAIDLFGSGCAISVC